MSPTPSSGLAPEGPRAPSFPVHPCGQPPARTNTAHPALSSQPTAPLLALPANPGDKHVTPDGPHIWSGTILASGFQSHSQALLKEWRWKDTKGLQWGLKSTGKRPVPGPHAQPPKSASLQLRPKHVFSTFPGDYKTYPWLRITVPYVILKSKDLRIWEQGGELRF